MLTIAQGIDLTAVMLILAKATLTVLLLDFVSGIVHWAMDSYGHPDTPFMGRIYIGPNMRHHRYPREFMARTYLQSSWDLLLVGGLIVASAWMLGRLTWEIWLFVAMGANAILFHKWMHRTRIENGPFISLLHDLRLIQTPRHHARHHSGAKDTNYCVITVVLNPLLDAVGFWRFLERLVFVAVGALPRGASADRLAAP
jgi:ubiquitin-conjugating enzyme E2 variant